MNPFDKVLFKSPKYSVFDLSHSNKMSHTLGKISPIAWFDMTPGDEIKINLSQITRTAPMVAPIFDRIRLDVHAFFVPYRLVWDDSPDFFNLSTPAASRPVIPQVIPYYNSSSNFTSTEVVGYKVLDTKSNLVDLLGYPTYRSFRTAMVNNIETGLGSTTHKKVIDIMKFYPSETIIGSTTNRELGWDNVSIQDQTTTARNLSLDCDYNHNTSKVNFIPANTTASDGFMTFAYWMFENSTAPLSIATAHTSLKLVDVGFVGNSVEDLFFWLRQNYEFNGALKDKTYSQLYQMYLDYAITWLYANASQFNIVSQYEGAASSPTIRATCAVNTLPKRAYHRIIADWYRNSNIIDIEAYLTTYVYDDSPVMSGGKNLQWELQDRLWDSDYFTSSFTSLSNASVPIPVSGTIQDLRNASQTQNVLERALYAGKRYIDQVLAFFGVHSSDARLDRSEVIGVTSFNINIAEVIQTSQTSDSSSLGDYAGKGISLGKDSLFHYKAEEHGIVMILMSTKPDCTYSGAVDRMLFKNSPYDFLIPQFAKVGEQTVSRGELQPVLPNLTSGAVSNNQVFGYNRRYSEYMFKHSSVHGEFLDSLDFWTMAREFDTEPYLNEEFISISKADNLDRVFSVPSAADNFYSHFYFDVRCSRPLPRYINYGF